MADVMVMPKLGLTATEAKLVGWLCELGDAVAPGEAICEVETEKLVVEVEAPMGGVLLRRLEAGPVVPVGEPIAVLGEAGEDASAVALFEPAAPPAGGEPKAKRRERRREAGRGERRGKHAASPVARRRARELGVDLAAVVGTGPGGRIGRDDVERAAGGGPRERLIDAGGLALNVLSAGQGDVPIVLVHGFGADHDAWLLNLPALAGRHPVHALDLPGHGGSTREFDAAALDDASGGVLGAALDALALGKAHLVGHSLGGLLAGRLAIERPERLVSLTLVASAGLGAEIDGGFIADVIDARSDDEIAGLANKLFADPSRAGGQFVAGMARYKATPGVADALGAIAAHYFAGGRQAQDLGAGLAAAGVPLQVIWGAADKVIPAAHAESLGDAAAAHVIEGAGHMVQIEAAAAVNRLVLGFVEAARPDYTVSG